LANDSIENIASMLHGLDFSYTPPPVQETLPVDSVAAPSENTKEAEVNL